MASGKSLSDRRKGRIRNKVRRAANGRPRLSVFRSSKHIYAQIIDDVAGSTVAAASTIDKDLKGEGKGCDVDAARRVGELIAKRAADAGIKEVIFDRSSYRYHGRVKALADAAREGGLSF
jgi:large subunit ribosomal protein L18